MPDSTAQHSTAQHSTAQHSTAQHSTAQHLDNLSIKLTQLKLLLPEIFCEEQIDFQKFQQLFSEHITTEPERYMLNWAGKSEAYRVLQAQTCKTLTPQPAESVNFDSTENIFIEGENLDVLKVLQKSYFNSIKMIYIDPPYNTGNDFVYNDNFKQDLKDYQEKSGELDDEGKLKLAFKKNSKENGHFHSKWLNMMLPRLHLAKNLLKDDGVIFISIDDNEQAQLKLLCDEVFGEENFIADVIWNSTKSVTNTALISVSHTYTLIYAKNIDYYIKNREKFRLPEDGEGFSNPDNDPRGEWKADPFQVGGWRPNQQYEIVNPKTGKVYTPNEGASWKNDYEKYQELVKDNRIIFGKTGDGAPLRKRFKWEAEERGKVTKTIWDDVETTTNGTQLLKKMFDGTAVFSNPKPIGLLQRILSLSTEKNSNDIILDFFSGSGTTAHAIMELNKDGGNRKFIVVQLPEQLDPKDKEQKIAYDFCKSNKLSTNIAEISKERIRRAGKQIAENHPDKRIDTGFKVFKLTNSHFKQWQSPSAENLAQQIELFVDPVRKEAMPDAMLYEMLLRLGLKLTAKVRSENQVFWVSDESGQQFALLLETLSADLLDQVISAQPKKVVTLDSLFNGDDALKKNAELQMNDAGIAFFVL
ncbi:site-specific DNA-methyltransferase [Haemophilus parainfluenzae]|uniref:site-specific DNA-methyltransferase (adenine-specific) n=1 Tax=Haemophilus parainfluenzae ATCC 33392 TaxID=888828 RepID=A0ABD7ZF52_HAEPA|nr:site-specific DNA-methyltransferase [Haemophilus parainfluenzae]WMS23617.1 site-specific DNA-methyltransferase [Haemophilus parainfluenzae ATCC 33392]